MQKIRIFAALILSVVFINCTAATNDDTPNLSFENGDFSGWDLYEGDYYFDETNSTFVYDWIQVNNSNRIKIMSTVAGTMDPTIACTDFYINPDGVPVARIGVPGKTEGMPNSNRADIRCAARKAAAERMTYSFTVTENTALLTYKFALVLADPFHTNNAHSGEQLPQFSFNITSVNPVTNASKALSCSEYSVKVGSTDLTMNTKCPLSTTANGNAAEDYRYKNWTTGAIDLTSHIGNVVTIDVLTHDCLVTNTCNGASTNTAGGHDAWGYFFAETRDLKLITKNCGNENPTLEAPEGFTSYNWYRSDGLSGTIKTPDPSKPWIAEVDRTTLSPGVEYFCEISTDFCGSKITISSELNDITLTPDFTFEDTCGGKIKYKNASAVVGDKIVSYAWDFGDGSVSSAENPDHTYAESGSFPAKLIVRSDLGCVDSLEKNVTVRYFPNLEIDGNTKYCTGDIIDLEVLEAETGSTFLWNTGDTDQKIQAEATTSQYFSVKVVDKFSCEYDKQIYVSVFERPTLRIRGQNSVCYGDTATLTASGAATYSWNTGETTNTIKAKPLNSTKYTVTGIATNGCSSTLDTTVFILPLPKITIDAPSEICATSQATLKANGAETYIWNDLFAGSERTILEDKPGLITFSVTGTDKNKCSSSASVSIFVKENPEITLFGDSTVCEGEIATLEATGAQDWEWHDATTENFRRQILTKTEIWTVTGSTNGCSATATKTISIKKPSNVWIEGIGEICEDDTLRLIAVGAKTYKWNTGAETDSLVTTPSMSTEYQVIATSDNGCTTTKSKKITVHKKPVLAITAPLSVCKDAYAKLSAKSVSGNASVYYWSTGSIEKDIETIVSNETEFTVRGVDLNGCEGTATHTISLIPSPTITFSGQTEVCKGQATRIIAQGAASYVWHDGTVGAQFNRTPEDNEVYTVKGTLNGCTTELNIPILVREIPSVWADGQTEICAGETLELHAQGAYTYSWSNGTQNNILQATPTTSTIYKLTGKDIYGCTSTTDIPVTVRSKPYVAISPESDREVCKGDKAKIKATGEDIISYVWDNGDEGEVIMPQINNTSTFEVSATDKFGCKNTITHTVVPVLPPDLSFIGNTTACIGDYINLGGQGAKEYIWVAGKDSIKSGNYNAKAEANMMLTLFGTSSNCTSSIQIMINVKNPPNVLVSGDKEICPNEQFNIIAQGAASYKWNTGDDTDHISYAPNSTTTYYVTGTDTDGCSSTTSYTVEVLPLPNINISMSNNAGCPNALDTVLLKAEGGIYYTWSSNPQLEELTAHPHAESISALIEEETTIFLSGRDIHGCENSTSTKVKKLPRQDIAFQVEPRIIEPSNPNIHLKGNTPLNSTWIWTPIMGENETIEGKSVKYKYGTSQIGDSVTVLVKSIDPNGCIYNGEAVVYVWRDVWAPTAFSPNSDEKNDKFKFFGGEYIDEFKFMIYNRLGQIVFEGHSIDDEWDGTFKDEPCPIGVYGWVADYKSDYKGINKEGQIKGFVTIVK